MLESEVLDIISSEIRNGKKAAMAVITHVSGSSPRKEGSVMAVMEGGKTAGTVGGGALENEVTRKALECIKAGENVSLSLELNDEGDLHMKCGGRAQVFIKIFIPTKKLIIAGGGHVGQKVHEFGKAMGFHTVVLDDREEYCSRELFPGADELIPGDIYENMKAYNIGETCHIVIVTRGHSYDEQALEAGIGRGAAYIGMIGSKAKTQAVYENLLQKGVSKEELANVYAPIGIDMGGGTPHEIALGILAEITVVTNGARPVHMRDKKGRIVLE
ncbi:xanthine dehydrogenase accessory factor [Peptoclostridium litorale DSM 5388]|uniref:Xanthine and CO dehydrogenases maturation factor, XdhC/CoxF family n=1 Tax=Peptoclostridium litorale DSM 5388 TaxID=1121324 RepID=A0A069RFZ3_PEPLI|nr:XdhC/CoxI family protein [Peptoclostridium litorale]KDR95728.1 xanthine and CO dehydrogenases maturation factor, XdhC/CoxF family [Peptoclostridium litorale DSM 5388]SIO22486.1 xanthine dehydrogenase accessory factor [Peptoclostridium litorale DSM 5388]